MRGYIGSGIKQEMQHIAVFHLVGFPLNPKLARLFRARFAPLQVILKNLSPFSSSCMLTFVFGFQFVQVGFVYRIKSTG